MRLLIYKGGRWNILKRLAADYRSHHHRRSLCLSRCCPGHLRPGFLGGGTGGRLGCSPALLCGSLTGE